MSCTTRIEGCGQKKATHYCRQAVPKKARIQGSQIVVSINSSLERNKEEQEEADRADEGHGAEGEGLDEGHRDPVRAGVVAHLGKSV